MNSYGTISDGPASGATLRFMSSFDSPVYLVDSTHLGGSDVNGYSWSNLAHNFYYAGGSSYVTTAFDAFPSTIRPSTGPTAPHAGGTSTRALYQELRDGSGYSSIYRNELEVTLDDGYYWPSTPPRLTNMSRIYFSRWNFYPSSFDLNKDGWLTIFSNREIGSNGPTGDDYSNTLQIWRNSTSLYFWTGIVEYYGSGSPKKWWYQWANHNVTVPRGRWWHLEVYIERSQTNGVWQVWVDGQVVFNAHGIQTTLGSHDQYLNVNKLYTETSAASGHYPFYSWTDDIEIWDGIPP